MNHSRSIVLFAAFLLLAGNPVPALAQGIEEAIAAWSSPDWDERERASRELADAWRRWSDADLALLDLTAREHEDPEVRQRASNALARIHSRRVLGERLVALGLDSSFDRDRPETLWNALGEAIDAWWVGRAGGDDLAGLVGFAVERGWDPSADSLLDRAAEDALTPCVPLFSALLGHVDAGVRSAALAALARCAEADRVPEVERLLRDPDPRVRRDAIAALRKMGARGSAREIAPLLRDAEHSVQVEAITALGELGDRETLESILPFLQSPEDDLHAAAEGAARALDPVRFPGTSASPLDGSALVERLGNEAPAVRRVAVARLGLLGARDRAAAVERCLSDPEAAVRIAACLALAALDAGDSRPAIRALLADPDPDVRSIALLALGRLGDTGRLRELLAGRDERARRDAALVVASLHLDELYPMAAPALADDLLLLSYAFRSRKGSVEELVRLAGDPDPRLRAWAVESLGELGVVEQVDLVASLLADADWRVRWEALDALAGIGQPEHAMRIVPLFDDPEELVRESAFRAFDALAGVEGNPILAARLGDGAARGEDSALAVLGGRGLLSTEGLAPLLRHEEASVRASAVAWLAATGGAKELPAIAELRFDPDQWVRDASLSAIGGLGSEKDVPLLLPILGAGSPDSRCSAISALWWIGHEAEAVAPLLVDPEPSVRAEAIHTLSRLGVDDRTEALARCLGDPEKQVRDAAGIALAGIAGEGVDEAVARWLESGDEEIRAVAIRALGSRGAKRYASRIAADLESDGPALLAAMEALGRIGAIECSGTIARHLESNDSRVAAAAAESLGLMGARDQAAAIARLLDAREKPWEANIELEWLASQDWAGFESQNALDALRNHALMNVDFLSIWQPSRRQAAARALANLGAADYIPRIAALEREAGGLGGALATLGSGEFDHGGFSNTHEAVRLEVPESMEPLARAASRGGRERALAIGALAEAIGRVVSPAERAPWIRTIEEAARSPRLELARYARIALVRLGVLDRAEVRRLVSEILALPRTNRYFLSIFLADALSAYLFPEAYLDYVRDRTASYRIDDQESARRFFAEAGLELSISRTLLRPAPVNPGARTSPRALLDGGDTMGLLEGRTVRLVRAEEALRALVARLEK